MNILALSTSTDRGSVALVRDQKVLGQLKWSRSLKQTQNSDALISKIQALLKKFKLKPENLDAIAVDKGPGSFTGCRVAVNVAKTFAYTLQIPVIPIFSLEAMAFEVSQKLQKRKAAKQNTMLKKFLIVIDAHKSLAYSCGYCFPANTTLSPPAEILGAFSTIAARSLGELLDFVHEQTLVFGLCPKNFTDTFMAQGAKVLELYPNAKIIGLLAAQNLARGERYPLSSWRDVEPSYIRAPEAVDKLQQK